MKRCFIIVCLSILVMSLFLLPVNAAEGDFSISTPLLYQSDHTHSVLYVSNGVQTQCVVLEHEYWEDPNYNENQESFFIYYTALYDSSNHNLVLGPHIYIGYSDPDMSIDVYDAFSGNLIYHSLYEDIPYDEIVGDYYAFPDSSYHYVYVWNDDDFYQPVEIFYENGLPIAINDLEYGKLYNIIHTDADERLNNVSALFYAFLNWVSNIVDTIKSSPILMLTLGIFVTGAVIGLSYKLIHK